ncbi:MAG TPA: competence/damage-inducible protein A [Acidobacteriota bacterium]|nr:competence/damage-inducible protein A [Acidobacteriota bacterium]
MTNAELIAVGSELLTPYRSDTNTLWLTDQLNQAGVRVTRKHVIGDDRIALAELFVDAGRRADIVIACGGLGPTFDDITREALADALGLEMEFKQDAWQWICDRYGARGRTPTENNKRQAMVPVGAQYVKNEVGTAPGLLLRLDGVIYELLPGPPIEMTFIFNALKENLFSAIDVKPVFKRIFKMVGVPESAVDDKLGDFPLPEGMEWSILAAYGQVEIHFSYAAGSASEADVVFAQTGKEILSRFGNFVFGTDDETLESVAGDLLRTNGHTIAVAESCSGGWLAKRLTDVPGSSDYFLQGVVTYSNAAKTRLLGVKEETLVKHGAVSKATALEMAQGVKERSTANVGVGITGIAGPDGGTEEKPVGLVYIAAIAADGGECCHAFLFPGDRDKIRYQATQMALAMVRMPYVGGEFDSIYILDRDD